jgi:hypothetical protein
MTVPIDDETRLAVLLESHGIVPDVDECPGLVLAVAAGRRMTAVLHAMSGLEDIEPATVFAPVPSHIIEAAGHG